METLNLRNTSITRTWKTSVSNMGAIITVVTKISDSVNLSNGVSNSNSSNIETTNDVLNT